MICREFKKSDLPLRVVNQSLTGYIINYEANEANK